jgi:hypothetical protein
MVAAFLAPHRPLGETEAPGPHNIRVPEYCQAPLLITLGLGPESAHEVSLNPCFCPKLRQVILSLGALTLKLNDPALKLTVLHLMLTDLALMLNDLILMLIKPATVVIVLDFEASESPLKVISLCV